MLRADRPTTNNKKEYHLHTGPGTIAPLYLIVGAPGRAVMIAKQFLQNPVRYYNRKRGMVTYTGTYKDQLVSVTTSGMGGPSIGIVLPEVFRSGGRIGIRVGSSGGLLWNADPGNVIIVNAAVRFDGASENWARTEFPAAADWRVVGALVKAANKHARGKFDVGYECTTGCFNEGQGRPGLNGKVPARMQERHQEMMDSGVACYSMEAAAMYVWCAVNGMLPCGAINAVFANRRTNGWGTKGEELASLVALEALLTLAKEKSLAGYMTRQLPVFEQGALKVKKAA